MQKQKFVSALSLAIVAALLLALSSNVSPAASAQATMAATEAPTLFAPVKVDVPNTGKITGPADGEAKALTGAGATFPVPLYTKWFSEYEKVTGVKVNYQGIGSGGGIKGISDQTLDFGASDGPMTDDQLKAAKGGAILHIAMTMGGVVPVYNVPEATTPIKFTPETLALIYLGAAGEEVGADGKDTVAPLLKWNDDRLVKDNPELKDVDRNIFVVHRSDGSGTTNIFTSYLSAVNKNWEKNVGAANAVKWPVGLGGKGNAGVAGNVAQAPYTIGYVELAYAVQNKLQTGMMQNKAGKFLDANPETVSAAAAGVKLPADMRVKIVDADGENAYPISGFTWILAYAKQTDAAKATTLTRLLWWGTHDGQQYAASLGYAPLPLAAIAADEAQIAKITVNGKPALPAGIAK
ncbi:MAG: phosphate ABC transporter substrate-binding protein PstS [Chloroflexota bacterium]